MIGECISISLMIIRPTCTCGTTLIHLKRYAPITKRLLVALTSVWAMKMETSCTRLITEIYMKVLTYSLFIRELKSYLTHNGTSMTLYVTTVSNRKRIQRIRLSGLNAWVTTNHIIIMIQIVQKRMAAAQDTHLMMMSGCSMETLTVTRNIGFIPEVSLSKPIDGTSELTLAAIQSAIAVSSGPLSLRVLLNTNALVITNVNPLLGRNSPKRVALVLGLQAFLLLEVQCLLQVLLQQLSQSSMKIRKFTSQIKSSKSILSLLIRKLPIWTLIKTIV